MFDRILIANRGEIACRVMRTARRLGVRTVAVYSDADARAPHVELADAAVRIGPAPAAESYLDGAAVIDAARRSGAQAVHPGYGFLAENAGFAEACAQAGLIFIGPPAGAIRAMGSKRAARTLIQEAGVPVLPGYDGAEQSEAALAAAAQRVGWPLLIKPSAGGGGKGMRVVRTAQAFGEALAGARREARSAFGDEEVILERFLEHARHVEVQVFADARGAAVHLFERDCSLQRRHQKVIEEAPAPGLDAALRARMGAAAVQAASSIGYRGAGTVEFLLGEDGGFYFMEMNTRLQVEHPVTEMITGQDLVEWQLRVAAGEPLPCTQEALALHGHAFEARLYAEDPARDFLPASGRLHHLRLPGTGPHLRIDSGVREGDEVSIHYDPMIAKLVVWDRDRAAALRRLRGALEETEIGGVTTNVAFLCAIAAHPGYARGAVDTGFAERHRELLVAADEAVPEEALVFAALHVQLQREAAARRTARASADPWSPWHSTRGWRLNHAGHDVLELRAGGQRYPVTVHPEAAGWRLVLPCGAEARAASRQDSPEALRATLGGVERRAGVSAEGGALVVFLRGRAHRLALEDLDARSAAREAAGGTLTAPMPCRVISVRVAAGDSVEAGQVLMVLEAMKMEHAVTAPSGGSVAELRFGEGDLVEEGAELLVIRPDEPG